MQILIVVRSGDIGANDEAEEVLEVMIDRPIQRYSVGAGCHRFVGVQVYGIGVHGVRGERSGHGRETGLTDCRLGGAHGHLGQADVLTARQVHGRRRSSREQQPRLTNAVCIGNDAALCHLYKVGIVEVDHRHRRVVGNENDIVDMDPVAMSWCDIALHRKVAMQLVPEGDLKTGVDRQVEVTVSSAQGAAVLGMIRRRDRDSWYWCTGSIEHPPANDGDPRGVHRAGSHTSLYGVVPRVDVRRRLGEVSGTRIVDGLGDQDRRIGWTNIGDVAGAAFVEPRVDTRDPFSAITMIGSAVATRVTGLVRQRFTAAAGVSVRGAVAGGHFGTDALIAVEATGATGCSRLILQSIATTAGVPGRGAAARSRFSGRAKECVEATGAANGPRLDR